MREAFFSEQDDVKLINSLSYISSESDSFSYFSSHDVLELLCPYVLFCLSLGPLVIYRTNPQKFFTEGVSLSPINRDLLASKFHSFMAW